MNSPWGRNAKNTPIRQRVKDFDKLVMHQVSQNVVPNTGQAITLGSVITTIAKDMEDHRAAQEEENHHAMQPSAAGRAPSRRKARGARHTLSRPSSATSS